MITKEAILEQATSKEIFDYFLAPFTDGRVLRNGECILSPFRDEKNPSFNIYKVDDDWLFKDFAGESGNCFTFVMNRFNLSFPEALKKINDDMTLRIGNVKEGLSLTKCKVISNNLYRTVNKEFSKTELSYFEDYGITEGTLIKYGIMSIDTYRATSKKTGNPYSGDSSQDNFIIGYAYGENAIKIYMPKAKGMRFLFLGDTQKDFIFGMKELPEKGKLVFIAAGEKDLLALVSHGLNAITLKSEAAHFPEEVFEELQTRFTDVVVLYDNDEEGLKYSKKTATNLGAKRIILPDMDGGKDVSDYFKLGLPANKLIDLVKEAKPLKSTERLKDFRLLASEGENLNALKKVFGEFILEKQLVLFPAERGTGKTFLMLQLCISISSQWQSFCGEPLELYGNTLYINFELNEDTMRRRLSKLYDGQTFKDSFKNASYCLSYRGDLDSNLTEIIKYVKKVKPVLVVIDNLRAAFSNMDNEKNKDMSKAIMKLAEFKDTYGFALVLVHHTKKGTSKQRTDSDLQSGAGSLTDLVDADFFLRKSTEGKFYRILKRMKSRDAEEQEGASLIALNPETLWFDFIQKNVNEGDHLTGELDDKNELKEEAKKLRAEGITMEEIAKQLGVNKSTISRWLKDM
jgi:AAA domain/Homeodomain-like domain/CHC2 zinc finger/Toprim-like